MGVLNLIEASEDCGSGAVTTPRQKRLGPEGLETLMLHKTITKTLSQVVRCVIASCILAGKDGNIGDAAGNKVNHTFVEVIVALRELEVLLGLSFLLSSGKVVRPKGVRSVVAAAGWCVMRE